MTKLVKMLASYCRGHGYLMVGVCLGLSLSLFLSPVDITDSLETSQPTEDSAWVTPRSQETVDEYVPKINLEGKPKRAQKVPKAIVRPRYYSTELGIREKIFIGVLTSREHLHSRAVAFNRTVAHLVDKIRYFITIAEGAKPNVSLPGIVGFTDTRRILTPFHVVKYITDNYLEEYDYYLVVKDTAYINARRLVDLVDAISVSRDVYLGHPSGDGFCSLDAGVILGNSVVRKLRGNLDWCVKNTFSSYDDVNFGRCVSHAANLQCSSSVDGVSFVATNFSSVDVGRLDGRAVSVFPVDHSEVYRVHVLFALDRLREVDTAIHDVERSYKSSVNLQPNSTETPWPIGSGSPNKPSGRFDLIRWSYFNETHSFMETDFENTRLLVGSARLEVEEVFAAALEKLRAEYSGKLKFEKLVNGWRRFDAARGMDYILDLSLVDSTGRRVTKRIEVCKPLGRAEILPVPYVTENSRVNLVVTVEPWRIDEAVEFMEQYAAVCMEKRDKTSLMLVLLYDPASPSKGAADIYQEVKRRALSLTEKYKKDQSKVSWLSVRTTNDGAYDNPMMRIAVADLVARKFPPESLVLLTQPRISLKPDYLNRVRMNTIAQWQLFSPVPFAEYHPDVAHPEDTQKVPEVDVNRNHGSYDTFNFDSISFYVKDYQTARRSSERDIPLVRNDKDIPSILKLSRSNIVDSIFELFVVYSDLHTLRAAEPALRVRYSEIDCRAATVVGDAARINCETRKYLRLGHRGQLAKLMLDYQNVS